MRKLIRRALSVVAVVACFAVIVAPSMCGWVPAWMRPYVGCPECDGSEAGNDAAGGGCSGASELRTPDRLLASGGRRMFEARRR